MHYYFTQHHILVLWYWNQNRCNVNGPFSNSGLISFTDGVTHKSHRSQSLWCYFSWPIRSGAYFKWVTYLLLLCLSKTKGTWAQTRSQSHNRSTCTLHLVETLDYLVLYCGTALCLWGYCSSLWLIKGPIKWSNNHIIIKGVQLNNATPPVALLDSIQIFLSEGLNLCEL